MDGIVRESVIEEYVLRQQRELRLSIRDTTSLMKTLLLGFMLKKLSIHNAVLNPMDNRIDRIIIEPTAPSPLTITPTHPISRGDIPSVVFATNDIALNQKIVPHELWTKHVMKHQT